ncbi:conserved protein of unknown function [Candidatus Filomicrobium marinum]|uniref:Uncharacterized protein n=2 Tax=Filomicrobium TaxID=119044 RepID=A0A0D6JDL3_9HYPH|nr:MULTISPECIES: hypothetical protein [Filomicrobium]MCV0368047.1 hypothetical protein [Filomicrobium sp.]CFX15576.1 conserved protein of unknown function [Candidatus Filomicrobium marinum]CPR17984.1 conserved protein of unknown function [Candidatus Filomicrobium marinum]SDO25248.1 hypothetical protein SAMN04488061_0698 [Filomicrobium insigne]
MRTYLISYDLANPNAKKHALAEIIMGLGVRWARPLEQIWYLTTDDSQEDIEARLSWLLGDEDGLLIQAVEDPAVLTNTSIRWFRRRGAAAAVTAEGTGANVVAFSQRDAEADAIVEGFGGAEETLADFRAAS